MKKLTFLFAFTLLLSACGSSFDQQAAFDEVMDVHDAAMPKIGEVMNLKKQVLAKAESATDEAIKAELNTLAEELGTAQEGMMVWMRSWSGAFEPHKNGETTIDEQKAFFAAEMEKVTKVKDDIFNSIEKAKKELK